MADSEEEFQAAVEPLDRLFEGGTVADPWLTGSFRDFSSFAGLSEMLAPAFPPGQHWISRALMYESSAMETIDWDVVRKTFSDEAPLGLSHCMLTWLPERETTVSGAIGRYSGKGFLVLVLGVHGPDEDPGPACAYVDSMMDAVDAPSSWKYDQLEHPLNKETFRKSFLDEADKVIEIRNRLDPDKVFFDPSTAEPSH